MSFVLTITDAAYEELVACVAKSGIRDPVVSLGQSADVPSTAGLQKMAPARASDVLLQEMGLDKANLRKVRWILEAGAFSRDEVPSGHIVELRGIALSFSPEWQTLIHGGRLNATAEGLVLADASGKTILPIDMDYVTEYGT
jgi:hypothetical protein